jgi:hypothetical protein
MPAVFGVYFRADRTPSHARRQGGIGALGFRVDLMPTEVAGHTGMLPLKTGGNEYDSRFLFCIDPIARGRDRLDELRRGTPIHPLRNEPVLADLDRFAHFRCNADEWPAAVCAAGGFAKVTAGIFVDPYGDLITDVAEIVAYARRESQGPARLDAVPRCFVRIR